MMASLRQTRRFSSSPTPPAMQHHERGGYYHGSPLAEEFAGAGASYASDIIDGVSGNRPKNVRKVKSQLTVKSFHSGGDGVESEESPVPTNRNTTRTSSSSVIESRDRKKRNGKTPRSKSVRPRDAGDVERRAFHSLRESDSGDGCQKTQTRSALPPHFLVPKPGRRQLSRSSSPVPLYPVVLPSQPAEDVLSDNIPDEAVGVGLNLKNRSVRTPRTRTGTPSGDAVTPKLYQSTRLPAPMSRTASPLLSQIPTLHQLDSASITRVEVTARPPSPAATKLSALPHSLNACHERLQNSSDENLSRLPYRIASQSRTPQGSPVPVPSAQSSLSGIRTLKDVTRSLEQNRREFPKALGQTTAYSEDSLSKESSPSSIPMMTRRRYPHNRPSKDTGSSVLHARPGRQIAIPHQTQTRIRHGLALTNENGFALGEPVPMLRDTTSQFDGDHSLPLQDFSARKSMVMSNRNPSTRSNDSEAYRSNSQDASASSDGTRQDKYFSQIIARSKLEKFNSGGRSQHMAFGQRGTPLPSSHGTISERDGRQEPNHDPLLVSPNSETVMSTPASLPKPPLRPVLITKKQPNPPQSTSSTSLPSSELPHSERSLSHKLVGPDTSSHSLRLRRRLMVRNPDPEDLLSASSSNHESPMSRAAAASGEFTIMALSSSQTSLGSRIKDSSYIVPDDVAAEVAQKEERRRKALAGLVQDLQLTSDGKVKEHYIHQHSKASLPHDDTIHREGRESDDDDEEDDDVFFSRLSMRNDENSLLEEPELEPDFGFQENDKLGLGGDFSDYEDGMDTEDEDEDPPLPPTPKFVHPLKEGDDLESRITRVASLHRISTILSPHVAEQRHQSQTWAERENSLRIRTAERTERSRLNASETRYANVQDGSRGTESHEKFDASQDGNAQEEKLSVSKSRSLGTDNEQSIIGLSADDPGMEDTLSSGAKALFNQLQVEAEVRDAVGEQRFQNATSGFHHGSKGKSLDVLHDEHSNPRGSEYFVKNEHNTPNHQQEPNLPRTWRSTLPLDAYDSLAERHGPPEMRRQEIIWELCETEQAFVKSLRLILRLFVQPLRHEDRTWIPGVPRDISRLFDWFDDIMHLHSQISSALHSARSSQYPVVIQIAETLRPFVPRLEVHQPYLVRLESVSSAIEAMGKDAESDFGEFVRLQTASPECQSMNLPSFLLKPVQRLMKYPLFFKQLWELTPRNHPDHLATFSLLHSTDMIIRVMQEVKAREEEYELVKNLASRIKGLPSGYQLARRERRLIAQGLLRRIILNEKERVALDAATDSQEARNSQSISVSTASFESCSLIGGDWGYLPTRAGKPEITASGTDHSLQAESSASDATQDSSSNVSRSNSRSTSRSRSSSLGGSLRHKLKESSVYAFVFTDLMILTTPMSERMHLLRSPKNVQEGKETWKLVEDVGVSRVLGVTDQSGQLPNHEHLIAVELMSMTLNHLDSGAFSDGTAAVPVYLSIPDDKSPASADGTAADALAGARTRWLDAFERCFRFTLRSLSFPAYVGNDLETDTKRSVLSILSSGLPLPMSPSQQLGAALRGRPPDLVQEEREERGWWSLRFQQVLKEVQRSGGGSPVFEVAGMSRGGRSGVAAGKRPAGGQGGKHRPLILAPLTVSRKSGGLLSLGRKKSK